MDPIRKRGKCQILKRISGVIYAIKIGNRTLKAHVNQLSKYVTCDKVFDMPGAKSAYNWAGWRFDKGSTDIQNPEEDRPKRVRKQHDRFKPEWFKTKQHGRKPRKK